MKNNKVSIIIPAYNAEKYIRQSMMSVIKQSYQDLQIIVIDDGSTDSTLEILNEIEKNDERVLILYQENAGPSKARNNGLKKAEGEYVLFVDADDLLHFDAVRYLMKIADTTDAEIVLGNYTNVNTYDFHMDERLSEENIVMEIKKEQAWKHLFDEKHMLYGTVWGVLYRRNLFDEICFPEGRVYEDTSITYLLYNSSKKTVYCDSVLYYYYVNENSITHTWNRKNILDSIKASEERMLWFAKNKKVPKEIININIRFHLRHIMNCFDKLSDNKDKVNLLKSFEKTYKLGMWKKIGQDVRKDCFVFRIKMMREIFCNGVNRT